jgi:methylamine dehydrogenase light chain
MTPFGPKLDARLAEWARALARRTSRRGFLASLGALLVGGAAAPLLPVARARAQAPGEAGPSGEPDGALPEGDPEQCSYWRYCAIDGFLSSTCGGTHRSCPPGTQMAPLTWLGTCRNPADGKEYVISYNDCCGKEACGRGFCRRSEGDRPVYVTHKSNDIDWCMGTHSVVYHSTVAIVVGVASADEAGR